MTDTKAAGSSQSPAREGPTRGELLPDIALPSADGRQVRLSDYRGQSNLVLVLAGGAEDDNLFRLLDEVAGRYPEFAGEEAEVIVIVLKDDTRQVQPRGVEDWPFIVLADGKGSAHRLFNALDASGTAAPAVFVADGYGEVYATYRAEGWQGRMTADEILQWLFFINSQCPECGVPEWPQ